eukprot:5940994-Prymnesium_polylepis.1
MLCRLLWVASAYTPSMAPARVFTRSVSPRMLEPTLLEDAVIAVAMAFVTSAALLSGPLRRADKPIDGGIGGPYLMGPGGPYAMRGMVDESILNQIREARSTRAPGFVFEALDSEGVDDAESSALAAAFEARAARVRAREALGDRLTEAIEREYYFTAASLNRWAGGLLSPPYTTLAR